MWPTCPVQSRLSYPHVMQRVPLSCGYTPSAGSYNPPLIGWLSLSKAFGLEISFTLISLISFAL